MIDAFLGALTPFNLPDSWVSWIATLLMPPGWSHTGDHQTVTMQKQAAGLVIARFDLEVGTSGEVDLVLNDAEGVTAWVGTAPVEPSGRMRLTVEAGRHRVTLAVSLANRTAPLRAMLQDVDGSAAQVQVVGGK